MKKKYSAPSVRGIRAKWNEKTIPDHEIDFSDIPEHSTEQLKKMKRVGRPLLGLEPRKLIAVRLDPIVLNQIKKTAKKKDQPYQTLINEILAMYVKKTD